MPELVRKSPYLVTAYFMVCLHPSNMMLASPVWTSDSKYTSRAPPAPPAAPAATGLDGAGGGEVTTAGAGGRGVVGGEGELRTTSAHERGLATGEDEAEEEENILARRGRGSFEGKVLED